MNNKAEKELQAKLDRLDYDDAQLIEMRVPLNLPYHNDWTEFERYNGSIEINGVHYNYVKRKVEKGELVLLCLPNEEKQLLQSARDQFFKLVNDLNQPNSNKKSAPSSAGAQKALFAEYKQEKNQWLLEAPIQMQGALIGYEPIFTTQYYKGCLEQPPDQA